VGINRDEQNAESMGRNESTAECKRGASVGVKRATEARRALMLLLE
jgi:hypothetical protein